MTNYADGPQAADARRASALTIHHRRGNTAGLVEIVRETCEENRPTELLLATLAIHQDAIVELRSEAGLHLLAKHVQGLAAFTPPSDSKPAAITDVCRSAALLDSHGRDDIAGINAAVQAAVKDGRPTELVIGLLDLYEHLLPELSSDEGIDWLNRCINAFAAEEAQTE
jgi:hypothetical protein